MKLDLIFLGDANCIGDIAAFHITSFVLEACSPQHGCYKLKLWGDQRDLSFLY